MTLIVQELRDALVEAGASEERANAAAKAVTSAETAATKDDLKVAMAELETRLTRTLWIQAGAIIGALSLVFGGIATLIKVL